MPLIPFVTESACESACAEYRSRAQWGMTFAPKRVEGGWVVEQDCTEEYSREVRRGYSQ